MKWRLNYLEKIVNNVFLNCKGYFSECGYKGPSVFT